MPELPEVETVRRGMSGVLEEQKISEVFVSRRDLRVPVPDDFESVLAGHRIEKLIRRGKYIIFELDARFAAVLHLGMSGRIKIYSEQKQYTPEKHDHVLLHTQNGALVVFHDPRRFGMFYTVSGDWEKTAPFSGMGQEPLDIWTGTDLYQSLRGKKMPIKAALLDQKIVAGLGNIYVCEALFSAGIHPARLSGGLSDEECTVLCQCARSVLEKAILAGGSTLKDYKKTDGSLGYFQYQFDVYDRAGKECKRAECAGKILRMVQSGRSTFYCPDCQK